MKLEELRVGDSIEFWYVKYNQQVYSGAKIVDIKEDSSEVVVDADSNCNYLYVIDPRQIHARAKRPEEIAAEKEALLSMASMRKVMLPKMDFVKVIDKSSGTLLNTDYVELPPEEVQKEVTVEKVEETLQRKYRH